MNTNDEYQIPAKINVATEIFEAPTMFLIKSLNPNSLNYLTRLNHGHTFFGPAAHA